MPNEVPPPSEAADLPQADPGERLGCGGLIGRFPVTFGLTVVTVAFFALQGALGGTSDFLVQFRLGALRSDLVWEQGELYRLFGAVFVHHGWIHFCVNWFAFLQLGALIEWVYGSRRLLAFYLLCGLGGSLASATLLESLGGTRGSSGAIFGLAGIVVYQLKTYGEALPNSTLAQRQKMIRQLKLALGFMLGLGITLQLIGVGLVDNYAHIGGLLTGFACAHLTGDPARPAGARVTWLARGLTALALAAFVAIGLHGGASKGRVLPAALLVSGSDAVEAYRTSGDAEARARFAAQVAAIDSTGVLEALQTSLYMERFDREAALVADRWLELAPDDPTALNTRAWLHVVSADDRLDPSAALKLVDRALQGAEQRAGRERDAMRAGYLDTRAEALFQLGRYAEALAAQRESVKLMEELVGEPSGLGSILYAVLNGLMTWQYEDRGEANPLPDMRRRLAKIERAVAAASVAPVGSR